MKDAIQELHARLEASTPPLFRAGDYAELVDESNPRGAVQICRKDGTLVALMARSTWDGLQEKVYAAAAVPMKVEVKPCSPR